MIKIILGMSLILVVGIILVCCMMYAACHLLVWLKKVD